MNYRIEAHKELTKFGECVSGLLKYDGSQAVTSCTFYNQPIQIRNTAESGCNPTSCRTCDGGCLLASEYQDSSGVAAIARRVNVGLGNINATSVCGLVFRSTKKFRYDRGTQIDGLIGLGYSPKGGFPTVIDSWIKQNQLADVFSIQLGPRGGAFSLGGYNPNYFTGDINWAPIMPSAHWYQVPLLSISVQNSKLKFSKSEKQARTIIDSGTTHLLVPTATFNKLTQKITAHVSKSAPTVPASISAAWENSFFNKANCYTDVDLSWLPNIDFEFKRKLSAAEKKAKISKSFKLTMKPEDYLYLQGTVEGKPCYSYGIGTGSNSMFIFGDTFMTSYYSIFDRQNNRLGFAYSSKSSTVSPTTEPVTIAQIPEFASAPDFLVPKLSFLIIVIVLFLVIM